MKNKYLILSHHKVKQLITPLYNKFVTADALADKDDMWNNLSHYLTKHQHSTVVVANVNKCNAKCVFCGQHKFERASGVMTQELFEGIIIQSHKLGITHLDITPPLGEPLLDKGFVSKIAFAADYMKYISMTTNGILLNKDKEDGLIWEISNWVNRVNISIGGLDDEMYKKVYGVNKFNDVITGIDLLCKQISDNTLSTTKVHIFFRTGSNTYEILNHPEYKKIIQPRVNEGMVTVEFTNGYDNWGGSIKPTDLVGAMKPRQEVKKCGLPCFSLMSFFVEHQGNVRLCGCRFLDKEDDGLVVGNMYESTLKEILSTSSKLKIFNKFKMDDDKVDNSPEVCKGCTLYRPIRKKDFSF